VTRFLSTVAAVGTALLVGIAFLNTASLHVVSAGQALAAPSPATIAAGSNTFATNCSFCHGVDARGGAEGGPDLTSSAQIAGDPTGEKLVSFLKIGRPPRMPAFNNLSDAQVLEVMAFLKSQIAANVNSRIGDPTAILVGDAKVGEAYFNGAGGCTRCHSVTGDLKGIGSKYDPRQLQGRMLLPRDHGGYPGLNANIEPHKGDAPRTVTVTLPTGKTFEGQIITISDYNISLRDSAGERHTFARNDDVPKVVVHDPLQAHVDMIPKLTDKHMHDLTSYLVTLK